jgi:DNA-binding MarR family transcriptional regulator
MKTKNVSNIKAEYAIILFVAAKATLDRMMKAIEFEDLSQLQVFLLVLVDAGVASPYDLLKKVGLGAGLTSPALKRLEESGVLTSTDGPRNRKKYVLTKKGTEWLDQIMKPGQEIWTYGRVNSFDALPRGIILSWLHYGDPREVHQCIARAVDDLEFMSKAKKQEAQSIYDVLRRQQAEMIREKSGSAKGQLVATTYRWLKAEAEAKLLRREAETAKDLHDLVAVLPEAPGTRWK